MYHIIHALTRWLAPIISFTAEEIWQALPDYNGESIFIQHWYQAWPKVSSVSMQDWEQIYLIRDEVNKALESKRQAGVIGSALGAEVTLYVTPATYALLERFKSELRFILITSKANLRLMTERTDDSIYNEDLGVAIAVDASSHPKCARCWHRCEDVGSNKAHEELCSRCIDNISGHDEERLIA